MRVPVPSPWLPGYIDVVQTVLVMLTMAGFFQDRPRIVGDYDQSRSSGLWGWTGLCCVGITLEWVEG